MEKYTMFLKDDKITIQEADYIEDGCYIEIAGSEITLYEIPHGGGEPITVCSFNTVIEAIKHINTLT